MIDMHAHTYYSDGTLSPSELVKRAAERGVKTLAVTDHDGFNGIEEALAAGEQYGVTVIPGVEFSTLMKGEELNSPPAHYIGSIINMHILGYEIDIHNEELKKAAEDMRRKREERNRKLLSALHKVGYQLSEEDLLQREGQDYVGKPNFALALMRKGYIKSMKEAYTPGFFLRHPEARKVHREKIHVEEAISLIRKAGGYAVLAHPLKVKFPERKGAEVSGPATTAGTVENPGANDKFEQLPLLLDRLQEWGLAGMECYYSTHSEDEAARLAAMAEKRGLRITSGSDFHGPDFYPGLDVGVTGK